MYVAAILTAFPLVMADFLIPNKGDAPLTGQLNIGIVLKFNESVYHLLHHNDNDHHHHHNYLYNFLRLIFICYLSTDYCIDY
jgi:hypothetical protein